MRKHKDIILVVLYNEDENSSKTLSTLKLYCQEYLEDLKLVIWDNSPTQMIELNTIKKMGVEFNYFHTAENIALSKIYNKIINDNLNCESIFIFDQDSMITAKYFEKMLEAQLKCPDINLFVPKIIHNNIVLSPAKRLLHKGIYPYKSTIKGKIPSKRFLGIMSGMHIKMRLFRDHAIRFDENLKLYGIDNKFSIDYSKINNYLFVIDYFLNHNLSKFENEDSEMKRIRFDSLISSSLYIAKSISIWSYISCILAVSLKKTYLTIRNSFLQK